MKAFQVGALWMAGWLLAVFALTAGMGWLTFGYLDLNTVSELGLLLLPPLVVAIAVIFWPARQASRGTNDRRRARKERQPARAASVWNDARRKSLKAFISGAVRRMRHVNKI